MDHLKNEEFLDIYFSDSSDDDSGGEIDLEEFETFANKILQEDGGINDVGDVQIKKIISRCLQFAKQQKKKRIEAEKERSKAYENAALYKLAGEQMKLSYVPMKEERDRLQQDLASSKVYTNQLEYKISNLKEFNDVKKQIESDKKKSNQLKQQVSTLKNSVCTLEDKIKSKDELIRQQKLQIISAKDQIRKLEQGEIIEDSLSDFHNDSDFSDDSDFHNDMEIDNVENKPCRLPQPVTRSVSKQQQVNVLESAANLIEIVNEETKSVPCDIKKIQPDSRKNLNKKTLEPVWKRPTLRSNNNKKVEPHKPEESLKQKSKVDTPLVRTALPSLPSLPEFLSTLTEDSRTNCNVSDTASDSDSSYLSVSPIKKPRIDDSLLNTVKLPSIQAASVQLPSLQAATEECNLLDSNIDSDSICLSFSPIKKPEIDDSLVNTVQLPSIQAAFVQLPSLEPTTEECNLLDSNSDSDSICLSFSPIKKPEIDNSLVNTGQLPSLQPTTKVCNLSDSNSDSDDSCIDLSHPTKDGGNSKNEETRIESIKLKGMDNQKDQVRKNLQFGNSNTIPIKERPINQSSLRDWINEAQTLIAVGSGNGERICDKKKMELTMQQRKNDKSWLEKMKSMQLIKPVVNLKESVAQPTLTKIFNSDEVSSQLQSNKIDPVIHKQDEKSNSSTINKDTTTEDRRKLDFENLFGDSTISIPPPASVSSSNCLFSDFSLTSDDSNSSSSSDDSSATESSYTESICSLQSGANSSVFSGQKLVSSSKIIPLPVSHEKSLIKKSFDDSLVNTVQLTSLQTVTECNLSDSSSDSDDSCINFTPLTKPNESSKSGKSPIKSIELKGKDNQKDQVRKNLQFGNSNTIPIKERPIFQKSLRDRLNKEQTLIAVGSGNGERICDKKRMELTMQQRKNDKSLLEKEKLVQPASTLKLASVGQPNLVKTLNSDKLSHSSSSNEKKVASKNCRKIDFEELFGDSTISPRKPPPVATSSCSMSDYSVTSDDSNSDSSSSDDDPSTTDSGYSESSCSIKSKANSSILSGQRIVPPKVVPVYKKGQLSVIHEEIYNKKNIDGPSLNTLPLPSTPSTITEGLETTSLSVTTDSPMEPDNVQEITQNVGATIEFDERATHKCTILLNMCWNQSVLSQDMARKSVTNPSGSVVISTACFARTFYQEMYTTFTTCIHRDDVKNWCLKVVECIRLLKNIFPDVYRNLDTTVICYFADNIVGNQAYEFQDNRKLCRLGVYYGVLCRGFKSRDGARKMLISALRNRQPQTLALALGLLRVYPFLNYADSFKSLTFVDKALVYLLTNAPKYYDSKYCANVRTILLKALWIQVPVVKFPVFFMKMWRYFKGLEVQAKIEDGEKVLLDVLLQCDWKECLESIDKTYKYVLREWKKGQLLDVIFASYLNIIVSVCERSTHIKGFSSPFTAIKEIMDKFNQLDKNSMSSCLTSSIINGMTKIEELIARGPRVSTELVYTKIKAKQEKKPFKTRKTRDSKVAEVAEGSNKISSARKEVEGDWMTLAKEWIEPPQKNMPRRSKRKSRKTKKYNV